MTGDPSGIDDANQTALMAQYGITRVRADSFHLGEWRYSNLRDAIAQARRIAAAGTPK
jgi:hypothetical protein